jgi:hypothetical protein
MRGGGIRNPLEAKEVSLRPPGTGCHDGPGHGAYEAIPWLKCVILGLGVTAMATLIGGLAASIRSLRGSQPGVSRS